MAAESLEATQTAVSLFSGFTISDILMIGAVMLAPLIAVRVERYLEKERGDTGRKLNIFKTLMATRGRILDQRHVEALNMIDLEFIGAKYKNVTDAWKAYLDHLVNMPKYPTTEGKSEKIITSEKTVYDSQLKTWSDNREDFLAELLLVMGGSIGYKFDKTHIKRSIYAPQGHLDVENDQSFIRRGIIEILTGRWSLPVETRVEPQSEEFLEQQKIEQAEQKELRKLIISHYKGEIPSTVKIIDK